MTFIHTRSARHFDLLEPKPADVDFKEIAVVLSGLPRFNNHVPNGPYSVAQHCVIGADYLYEKNGAQAALAFLLHDAHEAYMGDIMRPVMTALAVHTPLICEAVHEMKARLDAAIYTAADVPYLLEGVINDLVHETDDRLLQTEKKFLFPAQASWPDRAVEPLPFSEISIWPSAKADEEYFARFCTYQKEAKWS